MAIDVKKTCAARRRGNMHLSQNTRLESGLLEELDRNLAGHYTQAICIRLSK
jgi:hypothetical protein